GMPRGAFRVEREIGAYSTPAAALPAVAGPTGTRPPRGPTRRSALRRRSVGVVRHRRLGPEERQAGGEAVDEVPAPDGPELAGAEHARHRRLAEVLGDHRGVVVGRPEQPAAAAVAGED